MSARDASAWVRFARAAAAVLLISLSAVLAIRLATRRPTPVPKKAEIGDQRVDRKETIQHREYKDGRIQDDVRAGRFYLGADGQTHLEGAVEIHDYTGEARVETEIHADEVVYDTDLTRFKMSGKVNVRTREVRFEAPSMVYDKNLRQFRTEAGGTFATDRLSGSARSVFYDDAAGGLRLSGGFRVETLASGSPEAPVVISGDSFFYDRGRRTGGAAGAVRVSREGMAGEAKALDFRVAEDEGSFSTMAFAGAVTCTFTGPEPERPGNKKLEAGKVSVVSFPGSSRISGVEAQGNCLLILKGPNSPGLTAGGEGIHLFFDPGTELAGLQASGPATLTVDESGGESRALEADLISYDCRSRVVKAASAKGSAVTLNSARARIGAFSLSLDLAHDKIQASGSVTCVLERRPEASAIGFFAKDKPLFVTCGRLESVGKPAGYLFSGKVRAWQDKRVIEAGELDVLDESGDTRGRGGVDAVLPRASNGESEDRRIEAGGETMNFSSKDGAVSFEGDAFARAGKAELTADSVLLRLVEGNSRLGSLTGRNKVVVTDGRYEGRGAEALFDPVADTIVLTGRPLLVEKDKGTSRGDKLTFYLGDDRILIENSGQGRSITIVNRGQ